ncbi:hypothetical protein HDZ31DRAFT_66414 [Schizophyllum fasciatum]
MSEIRSAGTDGPSDYDEDCLAPRLRGRRAGQSVAATQAETGVAGHTVSHNDLAASKGTSFTDPPSLSDSLNSKESSYLGDTYSMLGQPSNSTSCGDPPLTEVLEGDIPFFTGFRPGSADDIFPADWRAGLQAAANLCAEIDRERTACASARATYANERARRRENFVNRMNQTYAQQEVPFAKAHEVALAKRRADHAKTTEARRSSIDERRAAVRAAEGFIARPHCRLPPEIEGPVNTFLRGQFRMRLKEEIAIEERKLCAEEDAEKTIQAEMVNVYRAQLTERRVAFVKRELREGLVDFREEEGELDRACEEMMRMRQRAFETRKERVKVALAAYVTRLGVENVQQDGAVYVTLLENLWQLHSSLMKRDDVEEEGKASASGGDGTDAQEPCVHLLAISSSEGMAPHPGKTNSINPLSGPNNLPQVATSARTSGWNTHDPKAATAARTSLNEDKQSASALPKRGLAEAGEISLAGEEHNSDIEIVEPSAKRRPSLKEEVDVK